MSCTTGILIAQEAHPMIPHVPSLQVLPHIWPCGTALTLRTPVPVSVKSFPYTCSNGYASQRAKVRHAKRQPTREQLLPTRKMRDKRSDRHRHVGTVTSDVARGGCNKLSSFGSSGATPPPLNRCREIIHALDFLFKNESQSSHPT